MNMEQKPSISIFDLETICGTLENVIKKSFGPRGQSTLMSSSTGHVTLSFDGLTILSSLQLSHPIARCIIESLDSFISHNGDGCKTMVLYLSHLVHAIRKDVGKHCLVSSAKENENFMRSYLSRSFHSFLSVDLPLIINKITDSIIYETEESLRPCECENIIFSVLKTVLDGSAPNKNCSFHLAKVTTDHLTSNCATVNDVKKFCNWFENSVYLVPNHVFSSSQTINGILLTSRLFTKRTFLPLSDINFICLQCPVDSCQKDDFALGINSPDVFISYMHSTMKKFLLNLKSQGISLIISLSKFQDFSLQLCQEIDITVIDSVENSDLLWICNICERSPVSSINDDVSSVNILKASYCDTITYGQKSYVKIILGEIRCHPKSFIICAPTEGLCQQLKVVIKRCAKIVSRLISDSASVPNESLSSSCFVRNLCSSIIGGNGYFEMLLCNHLQSYCKENISPDVQMCCSFFQKMLMAVPKVSNENKGSPSAHAEKNSSATLDLLWKVHSVDSVNSSSPTLTNKDRAASLSWSNGVAEVLSIKIAIIYSTVSLAIKLLRMDKIIGVAGRDSAVLHGLEPEIYGL